MKKIEDYRRGWFTHVHHAWAVIEWSDNIEERFEFIRSQKPEDERTLRAALIIRVPDRLIPAHLDKARAAYDKAAADYDKARAAYDKAWAAYDWESIYAQIKLANSPWYGKTIFSRGTGIEAILPRSER